MIGAAANEAARIESLCKQLEVDLLVSEHVARVLPIRWRSMGSHTLRGVGDKIELFTRLERPTKMNRGMNSAAALSGVFADWYWETDAELRLTYTSAQFAQTTGLEPADDYFEHNRRTLERHEAFRDFEIQRRTGRRPGVACGLR